MLNPWNCTICILRLIHVYGFCSYQKSRKKCCTKLTQLFLFHFFICSSFNLLKRTERKRNYGLACFSLSIYIISFSVTGWLIHGNNVSGKGCDRVPWLSVLPCLCFWSHFWFKGKASPFGAVSMPPLLSCRHNTLALFHWPPSHGGSTRILCSWGIMNAIVKGGIRE